MIIRILFSLAILGLYGCASFKPEDLIYDSVKTGDMPFEMEYGVYTPPGWSENERLPLILFLHGGGDNHTSFEKFGANHYFDQQISEGKMPRVILVSPNGRFGLWENWADGSFSYRDWVMKNVLPKIKDEYNTLECPEHCHLLGISMGGFGAMRFAYFESDTFSRVSALSAPIIGEQDSTKPELSWLVRLFIPIKRIFGGDNINAFRQQNPYKAWTEDAGLRNVRLQLVWGDRDRKRITESNRSFHRFLEQQGVPHQYFEFQGNHKWVSWIPTFDRVVNFLLAGKASDSSAPSGIQQ